MNTRIFKAKHLRSALLSDVENITEVNFSYCTFEDMAINVFFQDLQKNNSLTALSITYCGLHDKNIEFLAQYIKTTKTLFSLDVEANNITNHGVELLLDASLVTKTLVDINLKNNGKINRDVLANLRKVVQVPHFFNSFYINDELRVEIGNILSSNKAFVEAFKSYSIFGKIDGSELEKIVLDYLSPGLR